MQCQEKAPESISAEKPKKPEFLEEKCETHVKPIIESNFVPKSVSAHSSKPVSPSKKPDEFIQIS